MDQRKCECGAEIGGGKFCGACGRPIAPQETPTDATIVRPVDGLSNSPGSPTPPPVPPAPQAPPVAPPVAQTPPPVPPAPPAAGSPVPPPVPPVSRPTSAAPAHAAPVTAAPVGPPPFQPAAAGASEKFGISIPDFMRDGVALVALLMVLGVSWDVSYDWGTVNDGNERWWVIISVLLSISSLTIPYLRRAKLLGPLGPNEAYLLKLGLNIPSVVSIVLALVMGLINFADGRVHSGVVFLTGAVALAMQPRLGEPLTNQGISVWSLVAKGLGIASFVIFAFASVLNLVFADEHTIMGVITSLTSLVALLLALGIALVRSLSNSFPAVVVMVAIGVAIFAAELMNHMGTSVSGGGGPLQYGRVAFLLAASTAAFASRPVMASVARENTAIEWFAVARFALGLAAVTGVASLVTRLLLAAEFKYWNGEIIASIILAAAVIALCLVSVAQLQSHSAPGRKVSVVLLGVTPILSLIILGIGQYGFDWVEVLAYFVLPLLALGTLLVPKNVREAFGPLYTPPADGGTTNLAA